MVGCVSLSLSLCAVDGLDVWPLPFAQTQTRTHARTLTLAVVKVIIAFETNSCVKKVYFRYIKSTQNRWKHAWQSPLRSFARTYFDHILSYLIWWWPAYTELIQNVLRNRTNFHQLYIICGSVRMTWVRVSSAIELNKFHNIYIKPTYCVRHKRFYPYLKSKQKKKNTHTCSPAVDGRWAIGSHSFGCYSKDFNEAINRKSIKIQSQSNINGNSVALFNFKSDRNVLTRLVLACKWFTSSLFHLLTFCAQFVIFVFDITNYINHSMADFNVV